MSTVTARRWLARLLPVATVVLLAAQASAVPLAPATYRESVGQSCPEGVVGVADFAPESVSGQWSADQFFYGFGSWGGSAATSYTPSASAAFSGSNQQSCPSFFPAIAAVTYDVEVGGVSGAPAARVLFSVFGEATVSGAGGAGGISYGVAAVDPATGLGVRELVRQARNTGPGTATLNGSFPIFLRAGDRARVQFSA